MVVVVVVWGPLALVPSWRGQSGIRACPRRLAWRQRAPRPSFAEFCSRPPTWAQGQAPRQGPVLGNNAAVFLPVEGRSAEDEVGQTRMQGRREGSREGLSPRDTPGAGEFPRGPGWLGDGDAGKPVAGGDLDAESPPGLGSESLQRQQEWAGWDKRRDFPRLKNARRNWRVEIRVRPHPRGPRPMPSQGREGSAVTVWHLSPSLSPPLVHGLLGFSYRSGAGLRPGGVSWMRWGLGPLLPSYPAGKSLGLKTGSGPRVQDPQREAGLSLGPRKSWDKGGESWG